MKAVINFILFLLFFCIYSSCSSDDALVGNSVYFGTVMNSIPGVGLMMKGRTGEGVGYLLGDATLIGAGVGILSYANKQKEIMNDRNTTYEAYNKVKSNYNTGKTVSYCCFGAAAAVYVLNLVRSYKAEPKPGEHLEGTLIPDLDTSFPWGTNISVNLALTYKF